MSTLGRWHAETGDLEESEALLRGSLELMNQALDPGHPDIAIAEIGLAATLTQLNKLDEALNVAGSGRQKLVDAFGEDHWIAALGRSIEGGVLSALGRYEDAEPLLTQSYELLSTAPGARPMYVSASLERVIGLYEAWGKNSEAQIYREYL
jgi:hypothetical protein